MIRLTGEGVYVKCDSCETDYASDFEHVADCDEDGLIQTTYDCLVCGWSNMAYFTRLEWSGQAPVMKIRDISLFSEKEVKMNEKGQNRILFSDGGIVARINRECALEAINVNSVRLKTDKTREDEVRRLGKIRDKLRRNMASVADWATEKTRTDREKMVARSVYRQTRDLEQACSGLIGWIESQNGGQGDYQQ